MKKFLFIALLFFTAFGCKNVIEQPYITSNNDTINRAYLITEGRVGMLLKGTTISRMKKIYGENLVKQLLPAEDNMRDTINNKQTFYVYDENNQLLFIATAFEQNGNDPIVERITIKDSRFRTTQNIGINSDMQQIKSAYKDISVIQHNNHFMLFLPSIDGYMGINPKYVKGIDPNFISDIPIDSISASAVPQYLTISWHTQDVSILTGKFWREMLRKLITWSITVLPSIIFLIFLFIGMLRLLKFLVNRIKNIAVNRATRDETIDTNEALKRITTLSDIVHAIGKILLWTIFLLILLAKININIGPILASAGIVGLAVGFGAQELVRDFISGFFILLENQLRTGDMAIINGTTGVVEKIELRTITLRDSSGVVHIFQNGKINTLSNMTKEWSAIVIEMGVAYKENIDHVMEIMRKVGDEMAQTEEFGSDMLNGVEVLGLDNFADSAVIIKLVIKTRPMKQWMIKREYQRRLKIAFDNEGIEIPFPHISIYTGEATKPMPVKIDKNNEHNAAS